jgi:filamentous hemagglutinin family protein
MTVYAQANPVGGVVASGTATITAPAANKLVIDATTSRTVINWASFNIGAGESVYAQLPGASSILLNRVNSGGGRSLLFGSLGSNGQVYLFNAAGILVGAGAQVTAAQLVLSTNNVSDANFLSGSGPLVFDQPGQAGAAVVNRGTVTATGGAAILAGEHVKNSGVIAAQFGTVVLAGAKTYTVDFSGDGLLKFAITGAVDQLPPKARALVENSGTLAAQGGTVLLTAQAAKGVIGNVINTSGIVEATSVAKVDGKIVLSGSGGGTAVSGTLDASGKGTGETGGQVSVLGDSVTLASGARIDVSGDAGGGTALVGGGFHGQGLPSAQATTVAAGATIDADAITSGNGGQVAVWSDGITHFDGAVTARGGAKAGNGGTVETSGRTLAYSGGSVITSAAHGSAGTWLLDPYDLTIDPAGAAALETALASDNVIVETSATGASAFGSADAGGGDITVAAAITWQSGNELALSAYRDITVEAPITSLGGGNIVLQADNTHTGTGRVAINGGSIRTGGMVSIFEPPPGYAITYYAPNVASPWLLVSYVDDNITTFTGVGSNGRAAFPGEDLLTWGQLGGVTFTNLADGMTATSQGGVPVTVSGQVGGELTRRDEGNGWSGEFQNGDQLIFYQTSGTVTLGFPTGVGTVGLEAESDAGGGGPFTAVATIFHGGTVLASLMGSAASGACGACNTAPFLGFVDNTGSNITSMTIGLTNNDANGLAINQLSLGGAGVGGGGGGGGENPVTATNDVGAGSGKAATAALIQGTTGSSSSGSSISNPLKILPPPPMPVQTVAPPPPPPPVIADSGTGGGLTSVTGIDTGGTSFSSIVTGGGGGTPEPITKVTAVTPAPQAQPKLQAVDQPVGGSGSNLFQSKAFFVQPAGVPGINEPASTSGNRALWFASNGGV